MAGFNHYKLAFQRWVDELPQRVDLWWRQLRERGVNWRKVGKVAGLTMAGALALFAFFCLLVYTGIFGALPTYAELKEIRNHNASEVYSEDGVSLGKYFVENRINADFEEISPNVINALIATEDARFFEHRGIDVRAFLRVMIKSVLFFDESSGGGSTLSQQLAKNLFPRQDHGLLTMPVAKVKEMFIARRLENMYAKEELLNLYLNTVPFGDNVYGIKVAARRFFNKSPEKLRIEEAAILVGMLKGNTLYNPVRNPEFALERRNTVLNQMAKYEYITEAEADSLKQLPLRLDYHREGNNQGLATYFREHLRRELEKALEDYQKPDGSPYNLYTDGLRIYTTINSRMQRYAEEAVREHMIRLQDAFNKHWRKGTPWSTNSVLRQAVSESPRYRGLEEQGLSPEEIDEVLNTPVKMIVFDWKKGSVEREMSPLDSIKYYLTILNTGLLAAEPSTGLIRAWVGGIDHQFFQYDHVFARRQVGSTFKPIVYAAALQSGMLPCEYTENKLVTYAEYEGWTPENSDGEYGGVYSMEGALSQSVNSVTVEVLLRAGVEPVRDLARAMGISSRVPAVPSIALGTVEASLWDMVKVFGTFANRGLRPELHYLDRIETSEGEVIVKFDRPNAGGFRRALAPEQADMMIQMLRGAVNNGTGRRLRYEFGLSNDIAGKTGTTQDHTDGWFLGFTPNLVAGVWVGADNPSVHFRSMSLGQGSNTALPIWGRFMRKVVRDRHFRSIRNSGFPQPNDTIRAMMQCPPFLSELPIMADMQDQYYENPEFFNRLYEDLADYRDQDINIQLKERDANESEEEYYERMRKYNERLMRKEDRKEEIEGRREDLKKFWSDILFGDKKKKEEDKKKGEKEQ